jgi:hypothetical protein
MTALAIAGVGVCGAGLPDWTQATQVLRGATPFRAEAVSKLAPGCLPAIERRRVNETSCLAIAAALQAVEHQSAMAQRQLPTVFSSADGDTDVLAHVLAALTKPEVMLSPTLFHNSVFNAPAGYWSLGCAAQAASTTLCAGAASFAVGLCEARAQVLATDAPVLYVAYDMPFPESLRAFGGSLQPFACALLLKPGGAGMPECCGSIDDWQRIDGADAGELASPLFAAEFGNNAAAAGLPLLAAVAGRTHASIRLPYLDETWLRLAYLP